jgi:hypothetical protein
MDSISNDGGRRVHRQSKAGRWASGARGASYLASSAITDKHELECGHVVLCCLSHRGRLLCSGVGSAMCCLRKYFWAAPHDLVNRIAKGEFPCGCRNVCTYLAGGGFIKGRGKWFVVGQRTIFLR